MIGHIWQSMVPLLSATAVQLVRYMSERGRQLGYVCGSFRVWRLRAAKAWLLVIDSYSANRWSRQDAAQTGSGRSAPG
jgi:hypothetical protein